MNDTTFTCFDPRLSIRFAVFTANESTNNVYYNIKRRMKTVDFANTVNACFETTFTDGSIFIILRTRPTVKDNRK